MCTSAGMLVASLTSVDREVAGRPSLAERASAVKERLASQSSAQSISMDWQRRTGCGLQESEDPPACWAAKPALDPQRGSVIFAVGGSGTALQNVGARAGLVTVRVNFSQHDGIVLKHRGPVQELSIPTGTGASRDDSGSWSLLASPVTNPRPFKWRGRALVTTNGIAKNALRKCQHDLVIVSDLERNESLVLVPPNGTTRPMDPTRRMDQACPVQRDEKNWSPLVLKDQRLLFVYQHEPLQVVQVNAPNPTSVLDGRVDWVYRAPDDASIPSACRGVRGGSPYVHWEGSYYVALGHVQCGVLTERGCRMWSWRSDPHHCDRHRRTPPSWNHSCSRAYRTVVTVLDTKSWDLFCSPRLSFAPPPLWQCTQGWRGKWDVQYVHSLVPSGSYMFVGMEFENRCPTVIRVERSDFATLVDATIAGALAPDPELHEETIKVSPQVSRWAF